MSIDRSQNQSKNRRQNQSQLHIGIFGKRNSGKSTLINALTGEYSFPEEGLAAGNNGPVYKDIEVEGIGPCILIDTAGFDDSSFQDLKQEEATREILDTIDVALIVCSDENMLRELEWAKEFKDLNTPIIMIINKIDQIRNTDKMRSKIYDALREEPIKISAISRLGLEKVKEEVIRKIPEDFYLKSSIGELVGEGDAVMLVTSNRQHSPVGFLSLPEQQTYRQLLDLNCIVIGSTVDRLTEALAVLNTSPKLLITESRLKSQVSQRKPADTKLITFAELF